MCDMCINNKDNYPTVARPLDKYDYAILAFSSIHNFLVVAVNIFAALIQMMKYQSFLESKHANDWASISQDLETLEADNG